jgi:pSer/pThr/pTyr-binding forkhead associated (FHA) protein
MEGSAADTPATPEHLRASDAERDHAISELRQEFVDGRLSHETFMVRMQDALSARHRGQLTGLFTDLPPRRVRLLARLRATFRWWDRDEGADPAAIWTRGSHGPAVPAGLPGSAAGPGPGGWQPAYPPPRLAETNPGPPQPLFFPPGGGTAFTIGRTQDCDLRIADLSVSRLHAKLSRSEDGWLLSDLGSHNGTRVNGWRVKEPVPISPGDLVQFGSANFVVQDPERAPR